jgi:hypothetical protein
MSIQDDSFSAELAEPFLVEEKQKIGSRGPATLPYKVPKTSHACLKISCP